MSVPDLPAEGSTNWYAWAQHIHEHVKLGEGVTLAPGPTGGDDTEALQALADAGGTVWLQPGATYRLTGSRGVTIDTASSRFRGDGTRIDGSGMESGTAVVFSGSDSGFTSTARAGFDGIELVGPGRGSAVTGMSFAGVTSGQNTEQFNLIGTVVHGFGIGITEGSNSWSVNRIGVSVYDCGTGIGNADLESNGGERSTWIGCNFFDSDVALDLRVATSDYEFFGCSFDFNPMLARIEGPSKVFLFGCHVEYRPNGTNAVQLTGTNALFTMHGGLWVQSSGGTLSPVIVDASGEGHLAKFCDVAMTGLRTASEDFAAGGGQSSMCYVAPKPQVDGTNAVNWPAAFPPATDFGGPAWTATRSETVSAGGGTVVHADRTALLEMDVTTSAPVQINIHDWPDPFRTQDVTIVVHNDSGGPLGTITWDAAIAWSGTQWVNPAPGKRRHVVIRYLPVARTFVAISVASADY
jgi:hypothetical protein